MSDDKCPEVSASDHLVYNDSTGEGRGFARVHSHDPDGGRSTVYSASRQLSHRGEWLDGVHLAEPESSPVVTGDPMVSLAELSELTGLSRSTIGKLVQSLGGTTTRTRRGLVVPAEWVRANSEALWGRGATAHREQSDGAATNGKTGQR